MIPSSRCTTYCLSNGIAAFHFTRVRPAAQRTHRAPCRRVFPPEHILYKMFFDTSDACRATCRKGRGRALAASILPAGMSECESCRILSRQPKEACNPLLGRWEDSQEATRNPALSLQPLLLEQLRPPMSGASSRRRSSCHEPCARTPLSRTYDRLRAPCTAECCPPPPWGSWASGSGVLRRAPRRGTRTPAPTWCSWAAGISARRRAPCKRPRTQPQT
mmetsp:Transcript_6922/g.12925  ORF Transcript_6922/g.12925 Transcript_6922/m.12925 type:complete len:219 (-) Transcript_6922:1924-2580(-)